ncbi:MAG: CotH kinase family protein, partial [Myxococcota bacterium]|nr:CotH kinase family protein [Myxococcota bacterium]
GYWLFRTMGVAAPRVVHAKVTINGERVGVYANVEYIDGRFTRSRFEDGKGNLYKEVWPTWNEMTGELTEDLLLAGLRTNEDENPSVQKVLTFSDGMQGESGQRAEVLSSWMRIPYVARFIAVDRTIAADDGSFHYYCSEGGCANHNFYLYEEEKDDLLWLIPWDLDNAFVVLNDTFQTPADQFLKVVYDWNDLSVTCAPHPGSTSWTPWQMPAVCDPLFRTCAEHFNEDYKDAVQELLAGPFSDEVVNEMLTTWSAQIEDTVAEVKALDPDQLSQSDWDWGVQDLKARIAALRAIAASKAE